MRTIQKLESSAAERIQATDAMMNPAGTACASISSGPFSSSLDETSTMAPVIARD